MPTLPSLVSLSRINYSTNLHQVEITIHALSPNRSVQSGNNTSVELTSKNFWDKI